MTDGNITAALPAKKGVLRYATNKGRTLLVALAFSVVTVQQAGDSLGQETRPVPHEETLRPAPPASAMAEPLVAQPSREMIYSRPMPPPPQATMVALGVAFVGTLLIPWTVMMGLVAIRKGKTLIQGLVFGGLPLLPLVAFFTTLGTAMSSIFGLVSIVCLIVGFLGSFRLLSLTDENVRKQIDDLYTQLGVLRSHKP